MTLCDVIHCVSQWMRNSGLDAEFGYAVFTRRGVAFRGMAVNTENIPGHPGSP
jgi:hypothetical protein